MKKLFYSTMAVLAFSVSGMANTVEDGFVKKEKSCAELAAEALQSLDPDFNLSQEEASNIYSAMVNACELSRTRGLSSN